MFIGQALPHQETQGLEERRSTRKITRSKSLSGNSFPSNLQLSRSTSVRIFPTFSSTSTDPFELDAARVSLNSGDLDALINHLTHQIILCGNLQTIPNKYTKKSKTLKKVRKSASSLGKTKKDEDVKARKDYFFRLYPKILKSETALEYMEKNKIHNEIMGIYFLVMASQQLDKGYELDTKCKKGIACAILGDEFTPAVNLPYSPALSNLKSYLQQEGFSAPTPDIPYF